MPFKSQRQANLMRAAAHAPPAKQKRYGIDRAVAKKFVDDSKGQDVSKLPVRVGK
jgi:hypothetical protein